MTERLQTRGEVLKEAVERGGEAMRTAFSAEPVVEDAVEEAQAA